MSLKQHLGWAIAVVLSLTAGRVSGAAVPIHTRARTTGANSDITGVVVDSATTQPVQAAEISISATAGGVVANTVTDAFGRFTIHNIAPGSYALSVHMLGFRAVTRALTVPASGTVSSIRVALVTVGVNLDAVQVTATVPISVDTRTGDQVFKQNDFHGAPTQTTSQILQQSIAGAARAPTGEVHIRGQHAEYTYYIDGVPVPAGISGSLNELFDPEVVNQINFQTGGWDAEYGGRNAAVVNVTTKIPTGGLHGSVSTYAGAYQQGSTTGGPTGFNGQTATVSTNAGKWGMFISGARQFSDMRLEPVVFDSAASRILNFHNDGTDYYGFGKLQYAASASDVFALDLNLAQTKLAVPFDSTGGNFQNDHQRDNNSFINLGWHHAGNQFGGSDLFAGLFYRHAALQYNPDAADRPQFVFFPDVADTFNLAENRSADIYGIKADYAVHPQSELELKFGTLSSITRGHENFSAFNNTGATGPQSVSDLDGHDLGFYAQTTYAPVEQVEIRAGLRWDSHDAPFVGTTSQLSPRLRLNFYPSPATTLYVYYGRQFMPTNIEDLRAITQAAQGGEVDQGTSPERDDFYEAGLVQRISQLGVVAKLAGYYKKSDPGIDDNTVPGSNIVTDVNIAHVRITGIEGVLEVRPSGPVTGYINAALNHAYGYGDISGGFFPTDQPTGSFDLDHDQRLSITGSATYAPGRFYVSGTGIYGSGLTNGVDPSDCGCSYGTGLFDFNKGIKVDPSTIFNFSTGYSFVAGKTVFQPEVYVENAFNKQYLLKGAFFSGASVGRPRSLQLRIKASI
ncbi:MAG TPA: TonB-dependent receptor [Gemmatimonadaceae bacterium]|jgi:outer membrane receptor for ferrienterochelin and colicin